MRKTKLITSILSGSILYGSGVYASGDQKKSGYHGTKSPVVASFSDEDLEGLSTAQREIILSIFEAVKKELSYWSEFQSVLPESAFSENQGQIIELGSLLKRPDDKEVYALAIDENGDQRSLTPEQARQLREEGLFVIPSREFPGQQHVWKVSLILQKGAKNIQVSYKKNLGKVLDQIIIEIPERFSRDGSLSVGQGVWHIWQGLRGILSNLVGLKEEIPRYSPGETDEIVGQEKQKFLASSLREYQPGPDSVLQQVDDRLYDPEIRKVAEPVLADISSTFNQWWQENRYRLRMQIKARLQENGYEDDARLAAELDKRLDQLKEQKSDDFILHSDALESVAPGYGQLVVNHNKAVRISATVEKNLRDIVSAQEDIIRQELRLENPTLSLSGEWLDRKTREETTKFYHEIRWEHLGIIPVILQEKGLFQEAFIFSNLLKFQKESEQNLRQDMAARKKPARTFEFERRIWNSDNWIPEERRHHDGTISYYPVKYQTSKTGSDQLFWRLRNVSHETRADFHNGLYRILVSNLWNGPVGLRSMVGSGPFCAGQKMDSETGNILPDTATTTLTYASRIKGVWTHVKRSRQEFEDAPDTGLLGKRYTRWLNKFWNYVVKGFGGTLVIGIGQPVATVCNIAVSGAAAVTAPVWAPMTSLFRLGFSSVVYDLSAPRSGRETGHVSHHWFPVVNYALTDVAVKGVGQTAVAATAGLVLHPAYAAGRGLYGEVARLVRSGYDAAMAGIFLKHGRQPGSNSWLAWRIAGPGISSDFYWQIHPEIAVMALQAMLESRELSLYEKNTRKVIKEPLNRYYDYLQGMLQGIGTLNVSGTRVARDLSKATNSYLDELNVSVEERKEIISRLQNLPVDKHLIRQNATDLEKTLSQSVAIVESFYNDRLKGLMTRDTLEKLWIEADTVEGDFEGLTRHLYSRMFSRNFLKPLEVTDETFVIEVSDPGLRDRLENLVNG